MKRLLEHHVELLRLRDDAPFPSECSDHREMIKEYRRGKRLRVVAGLDSGDGDWDSDDSVDSDLLGE